MDGEISIYDLLFLVIRQCRPSSSCAPHFAPRSQVFEVEALWDIKICIGKWAYDQSRRAGESIGWRLPTVSNLNDRQQGSWRLKVGNFYADRENISAQFPFGMSLASPVKEPCGNKQGDRKQSHNSGANRDDFSVVLSHKLHDLFDTALIVFFFGGPLIGFGFLFLSRWLGGAIMLSWLALFLYTLSGLWLQ